MASQSLNAGTYDFTSGSYIKSAGNYTAGVFWLAWGVGEIATFGFIVEYRLEIQAASEGVEVGGQYSDDLVKAAQELYPEKAGITQLHHIAPKYLGGAADGALVPLDGAYHQVITNEFRNIYPYGQGAVDEVQRQLIMNRVYTKFPLPPGN